MICYGLVFTCVYSLCEKKHKVCLSEKQELQSIKFNLCGCPLKRKSDSAQTRRQQTDKSQSNIS